ncbi:hypothetical protein [Actinomadura livida]|uniref:Uncharacterized protein n=1 Tax=Actinomadura livida TaxID=79909 RepID=A0A7W7IDB9_9ACTN|nr:MULTISPECIES: hypothetical protein [Actinomadura]MBB4775007.1 hypothetical protein [Actinomadura catellatispora]GGT87166.1 hypothetical protein GCM10010208_07170 [Actinomadura livida]
MRRQTLAALGLVPVLALGLPACGDGRGSAAAAGAAGDQEKMREFAQCMRDNGVDMPDPSDDGRVTIRKSGGPGRGGGPGGDDEIAAAQEKCRHLMPNGGKPPKMKPEDVAKLRAYAKCMREHGIADFPDPNPDGGMLTRAEPGGGTEPGSREFEAAHKACAKYAPGGGEHRRTTGKDGG